MKRSRMVRNLLVGGLPEGAAMAITVGWWVLGPSNHDSESTIAFRDGRHQGPIKVSYVDEVNNIRRRLVEICPQPEGANVAFLNTEPNKFAGSYRPPAP